MGHPPITLAELSTELHKREVLTCCRASSMSRNWGLSKATKSCKESTLLMKEILLSWVLQTSQLLILASKRQVSNLHPAILQPTWTARPWISPLSLKSNPDQPSNAIHTNVATLSSLKSAVLTQLQTDLPKIRLPGQLKLLAIWRTHCHQNWPTTPLSFLLEAWQWLEWSLVMAGRIILHKPKDSHRPWTRSELTQWGIPKASRLSQNCQKEPIRDWERRYIMLLKIRPHVFISPRLQAF